MFGIGFPEVILILALALVIFGPKKLPEVGRAIGGGLREFKKAANDLQSAIKAEETEQKSSIDTAQRDKNP